MARGAALALLAVALVAAATAVPSAHAARIPSTDRLVIAAADADAAAADAAAPRQPAIAATAAAQPSSNTDDPDETSKPLPIVLWHGMGDSCCSLGSIGGVAKFLESRLGVFVHSVATGEGELKDIASSFYGNVNEQVADVCRQLLALKDELKDGFHMVGFSQGGQFLRAVVQRCGHELPGPVHTLVTMGAQHMGVSNAPACSRVSGGSGPAAKACAAVETALSTGAYGYWIRDHIVQAQYFKSPSEYDQYLERNVFLPDINNEVERSQSYKKNLAALERLVLYRFADDTVVEPAESSHFGFWDVEGEESVAGEGTRKIVPLCESRMYKEDWLGLRELDERAGAGAGVCGGAGGDGGASSSSNSSSSSGSLVLATAPGDHMQFRMRWFEEDVMDRWLAPPPAKGWLARARAAQREAAAAAAAAA